MALSNFDIGLLVAYAIVCIGIGVWSSRKNKSSDYLTAGRSLTTWQFIATTVASVIGGGSIVAYCAYVYQFGISAIMAWMGNTVGAILFIYYAKKLRSLVDKHNFHTLSDYFYLKFNKKAGMLSAAIIFIAYIGYLVNQFVAGSSILAAMSGLSYEVALFSAGMVILVYLSLGGFRSVVRTDIFQYLLMFFLFLGLGFILIKDATIPVKLLDPAGLGVSLSISFIVYGLVITFVSADIWQRVYAAKNEKVVSRGLIGSAIVFLLIGIGITMIGLAAARDFPGIDPNQAAAYGLQSLAPAGLMGVGLVLIFAAIMSSADTVIFVLATNVAKDYLGHKFYNKLSDEELMRLTRMLVVIIAVLGMALAYFFRDIVAIILTITGVLFALFPAVIGSFHWELKNNAVIASLVAGLIYIICLIALNQIIPELAVVSVLVSGVVLVIGQKLFK
ncbi:MAG: sodium:solute symporter [Candidatus Nanoarchaeia archaeon]